jgi:hypothetical protein
MAGRMVCAVIAVGSITLGACSGGQGYDDEPIAEADLELTGGRAATDAEFPSALYVGNCTGAKVGPRHFLVAAHCVHDSSANSIGSGYLPGNQVWITKDNNMSTAVFSPVTVSQTHIHPSWFSACTTPCPANILLPTNPPDVALIVVQEDTPAIPAARIDLSTVGVSDSLVIMGYGCENGVGNPTPDPAKLKLEFVPALAATSMFHLDSFVDNGNVGYVTGSYVTTPGYAYSPTGASLCPGDSGGPLYRNDGQQNNIVGVNAYYTFSSEDPQGVSRTNVQTRLDAASRYAIGTWLQGLGVNVTTTRTPAVNANFNTSGNTNGFTYLDDAFGTAQPAYASGTQVTSYNSTLGLRVSLGGIDNVAVSGMSGGWRVPVTLSAASRATLTFRYNLSQSDGYESNEASEVRVRVDQTGFGMGTNSYVTRVVGNGTGGAQVTTGWQVATIDIPNLAAGAHEIVIGAFNNAKTASDESTTLLLDDVALTVTALSGTVERTEGGTPTATGTPCNTVSETPAKAFDNLMSSSNFTKWCVTSTPSTTTPVSIAYDFSGTTAHAITSYTVTTGNDNATRDPKNWTLQGCQGTCSVGSGTGWVTIDTQVNQFPSGTARLFTKTFPIANTTAYQQYRLRVTANNGATSRLQITEIQLF